MTQPKDFDKVIQERLRSLGRRSKTVLKTKRPPKKHIRPEKRPEILPDSDEGVDKDRATKRAQKKREKHLNGYVSKTGRGKK